MEPARRSQPSLTVVEWGAIDLADSQAPIDGAIAEARAIPAGLRRRLGVFERSVVQAVLGLAAPEGVAKVTLGSRYGNLTSAANILQSLAEGEPPSPTLFSHSVLNAGCGVANQVRKDRSSHTAIAAGHRTLHGALTEAWLQTNAKDDTTHIIVLADAPFPDTYEALKTDWRADVCIGLRVARSQLPVPTEPQTLGSDGYHGLLDALRSGQREMSFVGGNWVAHL